MKIAAICCTYLRSHLLEHLLECWTRQDYPGENRELIILDDAGEYRSQRGDGWELISIPRRFTSLGEKRNASAALASIDTDAFAIWDDDDLYLPWALSSSVKALEKAPLSRPSQVLYRHGDHFQRYETGGLYHGGWAFTKRLFREVGGYRHFSGPEDQELLGRMLAAGADTADPLDDGTPPFYCYVNDTNSFHISWMGSNDPVWRKLGGLRNNGLKEKLVPHWHHDYASLPIWPQVHPRPF
jgi:hypothetical protein